MTDKDLAYLIGAYLRCGRKGSKGYIELPSPLPPFNTKKIKIKGHDDLFTKEFTLGPSILWIEEKGLVDNFLQGFLFFPGNTWRTQYDVHTDIVVKWMEKCKMTVTQHTSTYIEWNGVPAHHPRPEQERKVFTPTTDSLPVLHGIYWCKHTMISPGVAELGPLPEDLFKYVINKLSKKRYRSNKKYIRIKTTALDSPGIPKPQCLSTAEDYKDFIAGWYEGEPPEAILRSVPPFNKWEWLNERNRINSRTTKTSTGNTDNNIKQ